MMLQGQRGFMMLELLIGVAIALVLITGVASLTIEHSRVNRREQLVADTQDNARMTLSIIVEKLRTAGWDPIGSGLDAVVLDTNPGDLISEIELFADLDEDGVVSTSDEQVLVRHRGSQVLWRDGGIGSPFEVVADNISNDANGDGTPEPMFTPDSLISPRSITVTVTAEAPSPDPVSGLPIRHTLSSVVMLRN